MKADWSSDSAMQAIFLDIETTGLDPIKHRVLEIAFKVVDVTTGYEKIAYQRIVKQPFEIWEKRDPNSVEINGFTWEKVQQGSDEAIVAQEIIQVFTDLHVDRATTVYICQNPAFDRNFFTQMIDIATQEQHHWPYHWLDFASMYWVLRVREIQEKRISFPPEMNLSKNSIAQSYSLPVEPYPHCALNGVDHLILCYRACIGFLNQ